MERIQLMDSKHQKDDQGIKIVRSNENADIDHLKQRSMTDATKDLMSYRSNIARGGKDHGQAIDDLSSQYREKD